MCRNPLKSGQCFLHVDWDDWIGISDTCRNPLKSGQCFLQGKKGYCKIRREKERSRNPLKSGQCFLHEYIVEPQPKFRGIYVAIPSNRVNVSYKGRNGERTCRKKRKSRNPLKSGQCFLQRKEGKMQTKCAIVAIPSNRVNVSYIWLKTKKTEDLILCRNPLKSGQCFLRMS